VEPDLELERATGRPADLLGGVIGEEHVGDEAEEEPDDTDIEHQRIEQQEVKRPGAGDRELAEP
jgi:hypothetical protein